MNTGKIWLFHIAAGIFKYIWGGIMNIGAIFRSKKTTIRLDREGPVLEEV
jgi:hypothetical protein